MSSTKITDKPKEKPLKIAPRTGITLEEENAQVTEDGVVRALEGYLRQQALTTPLTMPRWVKW
ncbi:MAG: hypothetical protein ACK5TR_07130 [Alphaproteobacteria bacterium]|nr:hypothetical protein [Alphaproteobacteria bacterium]